MKLHILGSGTCLPSKRRGSSGYVLVLNKSKLLLDCGNGTTWKLNRSGIDYMDVDYVLITHMHPDHTSDLVPLLFGTKYNMERTREKPLKIMGPEGFSDFFFSVNNAFYDYLYFDGLTISELDRKNIIKEEFELEWIGTPHTDSSVAYKISCGEKSMVYTGDTDYSDELADFASGTDLLLIECSYPKGRKVQGHLTPYEVSMIGNRSNAERIVVTHMYPVCDQVDLLNQIREYTDREVIIAEDMMEIKI